ncbi:MAG: hypothetical protein WAX77_03915 [Methylococcaceae bacterium]
MTFSLFTQDGAIINAQKPLNVIQTLNLQMRVETNSELTANSTFILKAVDELVEISNLQLSCDAGVFQYNKTISWFIADWAEEKPLNKIQIQLKTANPNCKARIKIFTNGYWLPLTPVDIINLNNAQIISPVFASKIMVELVTAGQYTGLWNANPTEISQIQLFANNAPANIEINLAQQKAVFKQTGLLSTFGWKLANFAEQINQYIKQHPDTDTIPLQIQANISGKFYLDFKPVTQQVIIQQKQTLLLSWQSTKPPSANTVIDFNVTEKATLNEITCLIDYTPIAEKLWFLPTNNHENNAQFIDEYSQTAQRFNTHADYLDLIGIDIQLIKRSDTVKAVLALHPDKCGYPAKQPYNGALLTIDNNSQWRNNWLTLSFNHPLRLTDANWWIVLTVQEGEALWRLAEKDDALLIVDKTLYLKKPTNWLIIDNNLSLQTRLRLIDTTPNYLTHVNIKRGDVTQEIKIKQNNPIEPYLLTVTSEQLNALKPADNTQLTFEIIADAEGIIELTQLRIGYTI